MYCSVRYTYNKIKRVNKKTYRKQHGHTDAQNNNSNHQKQIDFKFVDLAQWPILKDAVVRAVSSKNLLQLDLDLDKLHQVTEDNRQRQEGWWTVESLQSMSKFDLVAMILGKGVELAKFKIEAEKYRKRCYREGGTRKEVQMKLEDMNYLHSVKRGRCSRYCSIRGGLQAATRIAMTQCSASRQAS